MRTRLSSPLVARGKPVSKVVSAASATNLRIGKRPDKVQFGVQCRIVDVAAFRPSDFLQ